MLINTEKINNVKDLIINSIDNKIFPGCVIGIVNSKNERTILPFGNFTYDPNSEKVNENTLYDLASVTKSIPTAIIAMKLIQDKIISLEDNVIDYIPEFSIPNAKDYKIKHLLTFQMDGYGTASLIAGDDYFFEDMYNTFMTKSLSFFPGTDYKYTNLPTALLGLLLEKATGSFPKRPIDLSLRDNFYKSLSDILYR